MPPASGRSLPTKISLLFGKMATPTSPFCRKLKLSLRSCSSGERQKRIFQNGQVGIDLGLPRKFPLTGSTTTGASAPSILLAIRGARSAALPRLRLRLCVFPQFLESRPSLSLESRCCCLWSHVLPVFGVTLVPCRWCQDISLSLVSCSCLSFARWRGCWRGSARWFRVVVTFVTIPVRGDSVTIPKGATRGLDGGRSGLTASLTNGSIDSESGSTQHTNPGGDSCGRD